MTVKAMIPTLPELGRETIILIGGALIAAYLMHHWPWGRAYVRAAWKD